MLRTARAAYEHLGRSSVEAALLPSLGPTRVLDLFDGAEGWGVVEEGLAAGRGLIVATGHLGNWELAGAFFAARGVPTDAIARRMANPLFDRYLTETRSRLGMAVVHDADAVRRTPRSLREGRAVAFLADQGVLGLASTFVPFFGHQSKYEVASFDESDTVTVEVYQLFSPDAPAKVATVAGSTESILNVIA